MAWSVFWETLRRDWRGMLMWGAAMAVFGLFSASVIPDPAGMEDMVNALKAVPAFLWQMLGINDVAILASPAGFIALRYFLSATVLVSVWAVFSGLNVTVNDETRGIANMVVSLPLPRWRIIVEKLLAYVPLSVLLPLTGFAGLLLGISLNPFAQTDVAPLLLASLMLSPVALLVIGLTVLIGALIPNRAIAGGIAGGFIAVSFILKSVAGLAKSDFGNTMAELSIFKHADALNIIRNGFPALTAIIMLAIAAGLAYGAVNLFQRRDLGA